MATVIDPPSAPEVPCCPRCGSSRITPSRSANPIYLLPLRLLYTNMRCIGCRFLFRKWTLVKGKRIAS